jgi:hypothetical protein
MATRKEIRDLLGFFSETIQKKPITDKMVDSYFNSLKTYSRIELRNAYDKCVETLEFFPKVAEIKKILRKDSDRDRILREEYTCPICRNYVSAIVEGKCWQCHAGLPIKYGRVPVKRSYPEDDRTTDFYFVPDSVCQECGKFGLMIKSPANNEGKLRCRECYLGMTPDEFKAKLGDIMSSFSGKWRFMDDRIPPGEEKIPMASQEDRFPEGDESDIPF